MFELTNEQRKCFALPPVLDSWKRIEVKAGPYDHCITYAFLDGRKIVKVIQVSDVRGQWLYKEYGVAETLSDDGTKILPKTEKGKPQNFAAPNLLKKTAVGMELYLQNGFVGVYNNTTEQCYYRSEYDDVDVYSLLELSDWVEEWCRNTGDRELAEINEFSKRTKAHQKFREGDFFRYRIKRNLYGYGRILVDYAKMRKEGIPFWDVFMGKPICAAVYHIVTENADVPPEQLVHLNMMPSLMVMDNIFFYGECEVIGNLPITPEEENYTIHYGRSIDARCPNQLCYQCGKTFCTLDGGEELYHGFHNHAIGWSLDVRSPFCLHASKRAPMIRTGI